MPLTIETLECDAPNASHRLNLSNGQAVRARAVVASGARYRRPDIADLAKYEGAGIF